MGKSIKVKACGATGLADALAYALARKAHGQLSNLAASGGKGARVASVALAVMDTAEAATEALKAGGVKEMAKAIVRGYEAVQIPADAPIPLLERRKREENANRITKHCNVIKRVEPRLLMELLQDFGSIEGLSRPKQEELIKRLEGIRKTYRI